MGLKSSVLFSPKLDDSARAFETVVFFSRPKDSSTLFLFQLNIYHYLVLFAYHVSPPFKT